MDARPIRPPVLSSSRPHSRQATGRNLGLDLGLTFLSPEVPLPGTPGGAATPSLPRPPRPAHAPSWARHPNPGLALSGACPSPPATPTPPQEEVEARQLPPDLLDELVHMRHGCFIILPSKLLAVQGQEMWPVSVDNLRKRGWHQGGPRPRGVAPRELPVSQECWRLPHPNGRSRVGHRAAGRGGGQPS